MLTRVPARSPLQFVQAARASLLCVNLLGCMAAQPTPVALAEAPAKTTAAPTSPLNLMELSATEALARMKAGTLTSRALTEAYLQRIADVDDAGPRLNAVIELNPKALEEAATLDKERAAGKLRGPLHGLPILVKDNIDVAGMVNSAGSLALKDNRIAEDAFVMAKLRSAGVIFLGKTNLSEWANLRSSHSISGWSSRGGQTLNPYVLDRNPCGSSSGTGSAISASLASIGIGTETDGSILCPSSVSGLVGLKPTVGLVSRSGVIPISASQDTVGPMGRSVADVALIFSSMVGVDPADPSGPASKGHVESDYTRFLTSAAGSAKAPADKPVADKPLQGRRLGVLRQASGYLPAVDANLEASIAVLKKAGAEVVDVKLDTYDQWNDAELLTLFTEFKDGLNRYLQQASRRQKQRSFEPSDAIPESLEQLIAWNKAHADTVMPLFAQELFEATQARGPLTDADYVKARDDARRLSGPEGLVKTLESQRLDALISPTMSPAWKTDNVLGDHFVGAGYSLAAVAGTPSLTVPSGEVNGLPLGLTFMGPAYSEGLLLHLGYQFEQLTHARTTPTFKPTLEPQ